MSTMNAMYGEEYIRSVEQPFMAIVNGVIDEFRELFEETVASGSKIQLQEVMNYMNEEAQRKLTEFSSVLGFRVEFSFNFDPKAAFNDRFKYVFHLYDDGPPEGRLQA